VQQRWADEQRRLTCSFCIGLCCYKPKPLLEPFDPLHRYRGNIEPLDVGQKEIRLTLRKVDGHCVYLSRSGKCLCYRHRPLSCRAWFCGKGTEHDGIWKKIKEELQMCELDEGVGRRDVRRAMSRDDMGLLKKARRSEPSEAGRSDRSMIVGHLAMLSGQVDQLGDAVMWQHKPDARLMRNYKRSLQMMDEAIKDICENLPEVEEDLEA